MSEKTIEEKFIEWDDNQDKCKFVKFSMMPAYLYIFEAGYLLAKKEDEEKIERLKKALMHYADYTNNQDNPYDYKLARKVLKEIEG